mgnify:CR=1 FL=1
MAKYHSDFINEITARGFIHQATDLTNLDNVLSNTLSIDLSTEASLNKPHINSLLLRELRFSVESLKVILFFIF